MGQDDSFHAHLTVVHNRAKWSVSIALICTTRRWIPASSNTNEGPRNVGLILLRDQVDAAHERVHRIQSLAEHELRDELARHDSSSRPETDSSSSDLHRQVQKAYMGAMVPPRFAHAGSWFFFFMSQIPPSTNSSTSWHAASSPSGDATSSSADLHRQVQKTYAGAMMPPRFAREAALTLFSISCFVTGKTPSPRK